MTGKSGDSFTSRSDGRDPQRADRAAPGEESIPIEVEIRRFLAENLIFSEDGFSYSDDASLLDEGIVDSMGVLELVAFVGSAFGVSVEPREVTPENFDSVARLARYVRSKLARPG